MDPYVFVKFNGYRLGKVEKVHHSFWPSFMSSQAKNRFDKSKTLDYWKKYARKDHAREYLEKFGVGFSEAKFAQIEPASLLFVWADLDALATQWKVVYELMKDKRVPAEVLMANLSTIYHNMWFRLFMNIFNDRSSFEGSLEGMPIRERHKRLTETFFAKFKDQKTSLLPRLYVAKKILDSINALATILINLPEVKPRYTDEKSPAQRAFEEVFNHAYDSKIRGVMDISDLTETQLQKLVDLYEHKRAAPLKSSN